ncbi:ABC-type transport auxiliary lipoprotein family protein [Oceanibacterium hippocampi]|nr:ABC-type transport auxiliary lipoprotein family protein [Oceanibacterium hippocampi]
MTAQIATIAGRSALVGLLLLLGGCAGSLLPGSGPAPNLYTLTPKSTFRDDLPKVDWQLVVEEPLAAGGLDNVKIALRPNQTEFKYFADARWTDRAPRMIQMLIVESFENSGRIVAVGRQSVGLRSDYNLRSDLREFQAEYFDDDNPVIRVRLNVKMIRQPRQEIIASETFEGSVRSEGRDMQSIVLAFDDALGTVLRRVVEWGLLTPGKVAPR